MKLLRYGAVGAEKTGALDSRGGLRDLSLLVPELTPEWLASDRLRALSAIDLEKMPLVEGTPRLGRVRTGDSQGAGGLHESHHFPLRAE
jgi:2,4-diketo-3-deoxy-L-fuconate hydrolase